MSELEDRQVIPLSQLSLAGAPATLDRRGFCQALAATTAGALLIPLGGCGVPAAFVPEDAGDDAQQAPEVDFARAGASDMAAPRSDLPAPAADAARHSDLNGNQCAFGLSDTKMVPTQFAVGTATYFKGDNVFVCRDADGFFALTAVCTHAGCIVNFVGPGFHCPCHFSAYSYDGSVTNGPANRPLAHFAMCLVDGGTVGYDTNTRLTGLADRYNF